MASNGFSPSLLGFPSMGSTLGATYLGGMGATLLYGATLTQTLSYYRNYPQDWIFQKIAVAFLLVMDTIHMALTITELWHYLIDSFGNFTALLSVTWSVKLQLAINVVIIITVQCLYTWRVWKFNASRSLIWPLILLIVFIAASAVGILVAVRSYQATSFVEFESKRYRWTVYLAFAMPTLNDIFLTAGMCHLLYKSKSMFSETRSKIWVIMRYVIISGALTSTCSLTALITYATMPDNLVYLGLEFLLTKLYINSYLAMLNARRSIKEHTTSGGSNAIQMYDVEYRSQTRYGYGGHSSTEPQNDFKETRNPMTGAVRVTVEIARNTTTESSYEYGKTPSELEIGKEPNAL